MALSKETQRQVRPEQPTQAWKRVAERIRKKTGMIVESLGERLVPHELPLTDTSVPAKQIGAFRLRSLHNFDKIVCCDSGLFENAVQCPKCNFVVQRHNTTNAPFSRGPFHDNMASTLTHLNETKSLQHTNNFPPRQMW